MTEAGNVFVGEALGSVNTGEGPQINYYLAAATSRLREEAHRRPLTISEKDRDHLYQRFLDPPGMQQARELLAETHTALLDGAPGNGRRAAALMLLHTLPHATGSLYELPDTADDSTATVLSPHQIRPGSRVLLDLSEVDESRYLTVQQHLFDVRDHLSRVDAYLVLVLPHHLKYLLRDDLRRLTIEVGRPAPHHVLARHLQCNGLRPGDLSDRELVDYLLQAPMRRVAALANRICEHRAAAGGKDGFPRWLESALADVHDQAARVAADLATTQDGRRRALLLSLAMFHGSQPSTILHATNTLLRVLAHPRDETPLLERADLHAEFKAIGAEMRTDSRMRFTVAGYGHSVLNHFWTFHPDIRQQLRDWFRICVADRGLPQAERGKPVARFAEQALRSDRPDDLRWLVDRWTRESAPAYLVPDASQALAVGLADDKHGRYFRQQIYDWSTTSDTSYALRRVLILVCSEAMARTHPDQALVRLHHLARRTTGRIGTAAEEALVSLARSNDRLYSTALDRLRAGVEQERWQSRDAALFLALADPTRDDDSTSVRVGLTAGWTAVLGRPDNYWTESAVQWLDACLQAPRRRTRITAILGAAGGTNVISAGRLFRVARSWRAQGSNSSTERTSVTALLLRELDAHQGLAVTASDL